MIGRYKKNMLYKWDVYTQLLYTYTFSSVRCSLHIYILYITQYYTIQMRRSLHSNTSNGHLVTLSGVIQNRPLIKPGLTCFYIHGAVPNPNLHPILFASWRWCETRWQKYSALEMNTYLWLPGNSQGHYNICKSAFSSAVTFSELRYYYIVYYISCNEKSE